MMTAKATGTAFHHGLLGIHDLARAPIYTAAVQVVVGARDLQHAIVYRDVNALPRTHDQR